MKILGIDWGDVGRQTFGVVHTAGKTLASAFGAGHLAQQVENLEAGAGLLPDWARSPGATTPQGVSVTAPDFVVVQRGDQKSDVLTSVAVVVVTGGKRFEGTGYRSGEGLGKKFSFGYEAPSRVDVSTKDGKKVSLTDAKMLLFGGGQESVSKVIGFERSGDMSTKDQVLGDEILNDLSATVEGWTEIVGDVPGDFEVGMLDGVDVLGAFKPIDPKKVTQRAGFQIKRSPAAGRTFTSLVVNRAAKRRLNPKATLNTVRMVAKRAQQVGKQLLDASNKLPAASTKVKGAVGPIKARPGRPVRASGTLRLGPAAMKVLATKTIEAGKKLGGVADKYRKVVDAIPAKQKASLIKARAATKIRGDGYDVLGGDQWTEIVGDNWIELVGAVFALDLVGDPPPIPDPLNPGFLTDQSPDPAYAGGGSAAADAGTSTTAPSAGAASLLPGPPDYGAGPPPTMESVAAAMQAGFDYMPDPYPNGNDPTFYDCPTDADLPIGAIVFDGSRGAAYKDLANYTIFFGVLPDGTTPKGGHHSGYELHDDGWWFYLQGKSGPMGGYGGDRHYGKSAPPDHGMVFESKKNNWGPLMGNPERWSRGLRFSPSSPGGGGRWFWFWDTAPQWAKLPILQARFNDAIVTHQAAMVAGQTDYANAVLQDQLDAKTAADQARALAADDAKRELERREQDAQQLAWEQQQMQQQAVYEQQQAQQEMQQQMQERQMEMQMLQQQAKLEAQEQKMMLDFFSAHPEMMNIPQEADYGSDGGDWGDDGRGDVPAQELEEGW